MASRKPGIGWLQPTSPDRGPGRPHEPTGHSMKTYPRNRSRGPRLVGSVLGLVGVTACGTSKDVAAETAARDLVTAVAQGDGDAACALLAPEARDELERSSGEPCVRAVMAEDLPIDRDPESTHVFDTMAQVQFASGPGVPRPLRWDVAGDRRRVHARSRPALRLQHPGVLTCARSSIPTSPSSGSAWR